jgi:hypothetical protein
VDLAEFDGRFDLDTSDAISADLIIKRLKAAPPGTTVVVDYLQLLDQQRQKPALADQVSVLQLRSTT